MAEIELDPEALKAAAHAWLENASDYARLDISIEAAIRAYLEATRPVPTDEAVEAAVLKADWHKLGPMPTDPELEDKLGNVKYDDTPLRARAALAHTGGKVGEAEPTFIGRQPVLCAHGWTDPNNLCPACEGDLCDDCPPVGYPTDETRCSVCPRSLQTGGET